MEDAGAGAVVMHSLFEEQLEHESMAFAAHLTAGSESYAEALSYFPDLDEFHIGPEEYLEHIHGASEALSIPVIGSLNAVSTSAWKGMAKRIQQAGAQALECNVYYLPGDPRQDGREVEKIYVDILRALRREVSIPVAMRLSPFFSAIPSMAARLEESGADGMDLFNRFYPPDIDLDELTVRPRLVRSPPEESRLALRWIAILHRRVGCSLAATGGVHSGLDAARMILAGADAVQTCSALLANGIGHIRTMLDQLCRWMEEKDYESVVQMKGALSQRSCPDPAAFERANCMKPRISYKE